MPTGAMFELRKPPVVRLFIFSYALWSTLFTGVFGASNAVAQDARPWQPLYCEKGYVQKDNACVAISQISDAEIRQHLINRSLATYPGSCPCPYFVDRAGRSCGARSAWSRAGGYSPLCYPADVSNEAVEKFRRNS